MKAIYKKVSQIFLADTTLKNLVGYTAAKANIRRAYVPQGEWDKLLIFYTQPEAVIPDVGPNVRYFNLMIRISDRNNDLNCDDIGERVVALLHDTSMTVAGEMFGYTCQYKGELVATNWNEELKAYDKILQFQIFARKL